MDHITLLAELYQAYKNEDTEYVYTLKEEYPELFAETTDMIIRSNSKEEFDKLIEDLTK